MAVEWTITIEGKNEFGDICRKEVRIAKSWERLFDGDRGLSIEDGKLNAKRESTSEIAQKLGIRYQHAYNVLKGSSNAVVSVGEKAVVPARVEKPPLPVWVLSDGGFSRIGRRTLSSAEGLVVDQPLPKDVVPALLAKTSAWQDCCDGQRPPGTGDQTAGEGDETGGLISAQPCSPAGRDARP